MAFLPVTERFLSDHHHLCRRCYRKSRPNDRRTMPGLPSRGGAKTTTRRTEQAQNGGVAASLAPLYPSQARTPPVLDAPGRMTKEVGSDRVPYRRHYHRAVYADLLGGVAGGVATSGRPAHMDEDLQPLTPLHYQVDARFLPNALRGLMRPSIVGPIPRVFLTVLNAAWPTDLNVPCPSRHYCRAGRGQLMASLVEAARVVSVASATFSAEVAGATPRAPVRRRPRGERPLPALGV